MKQTDQIQNVIDEFKRDSYLRQYRFQKILRIVLLPFAVVPILVFAYFSYKIGNYFGAFSLSCLGIGILIGAFWLFRKYPERFIEARKPLSLKQKIIEWALVVLILAGYWYVR